MRPPIGEPLAHMLLSYPRGSLAIVALGVVAACLASTRLLAIWLKGFADTWIDGDDTASSYSLR